MVAGEQIERAKSIDRASQKEVVVQIVQGIANSKYDFVDLTFLILMKVAKKAKGTSASNDPHPNSLTDGAGEEVIVVEDEMTTPNARIEASPNAPMVQPSGIQSEINVDVLMDNVVLGQTSAVLPGIVLRVAISNG
ncbi:hypothetical protein QYF36_003773 [Acer negundo]|nr:hypothetical protein QYF36_003773 [Acer negundo]